MRCSVLADPSTMSGVDAPDRVGLVRVGVQLGLLVDIQMGCHVERDLLHGAGEDERRSVRVGAINDQPVVPSDVQARVAAEPERHRVVQPSLAHRFAVDEQRDLTGGRGFRLVCDELQLDGDVAGRQRRVGLLVVFEDPKEGIGVLELPLVHEQ
jgi:hypothetical protein